MDYRLGPILQAQAARRNQRAEAEASLSSLIYDPKAAAEFERGVHEIRAMRGVVAAAQAHERQMAIATRGVSLKPVEHPLARINRQFYLDNGRFPTQSEVLRRLL
jgi:hypothetical protein